MIGMTINHNYTMQPITLTEPKITEWTTDYALFVSNGIEYVINYDKQEILDIHGMVTRHKDSGYGRYEKHVSWKEDAEWDDVCVETVEEFINTNQNRWELDNE